MKVTHYRGFHGFELRGQFSCVEFQGVGPAVHGAGAGRRGDGHAAGAAVVPVDAAQPLLGLAELAHAPGVIHPVRRDQRGLDQPLQFAHVDLRPPDAEQPIDIGQGHVPTSSLLMTAPIG